MRKPITLALLILAAALLPSVPASASARAMEVRDVVEVRQIPETRISPDGRQVAFLVTEPSVATHTVTSRIMVADFDRPDRARSVYAGDRVTDLGWHGNSITFLTAMDGADEVWSVPAAGGRPRKLFDAPVPAVPIGGQRFAFYNSNTPAHDAKILRHQWSPDGRSLAFITPHLVKPDTSGGVVYDEAKYGIQSIVEGQYGSARVGVWVWEAGRPRHLTDVDLGPQGGLGPLVAWSADSDRLELAFRGKSWVVDVRTGGQVNTPLSTPPARQSLASDNLSAFSYAANRAAAVRQSWSSPPRLVVMEGQTIREGHNPNAQFASIQFQPPVAAQWTDPHGHKAGGYQIVPPQCRSTRCPTVVITHGGDAARNGFMSEAHEWQYPSQLFAAKGFVVLGVDESPTAPGGPGKDWPETLRNMLEPVTMMEAAVRQGIDAGFVDPGRVGIAGYSRGAEVSQLAAAHSSMFKAVSAGEGGNGTVGYWLLGAQNPNVAERAKQVFGGSPVDPQAAEHWQQYAADLRAAQIRTPMLLQAASFNAVANLELRAYLKAQGVPVELIVFPGETHIFHQPAHRAAAMTQNLTWFDRWLASA
ncbi:prolyl oligopeptidase family serine peptidase [Kibdelosporangium philippinense]|uniref:Prolyl oligopeptidase family serine peptidase n=1 Tax=Kibdelosporangium philippinense TaxID=211113 RepID=A0ABS8ZFI7_9PSEU|nr:prolyl oligopeptidase family serine peptidase [Kibdelosporangium philippinense]MCE7005441.1 prolyl oligopeptidase family serine peptidase [Kibdelosporangium philippinense]